MLTRHEVSDELFKTFRDFVSKKMGLYFLDTRRQDLLRGVQHAADTFGYKDIETCMTQLLKVDWTDKQIQTLASYLTVGETHFCRHKEHMNYFVEKILRDSAFYKRKSLKIWSAGCCTGDEAYTLAIMLHETIPFIDKCDISILATDINPVFMNIAKEAIFTRNSFRETPELLQKKYFKHIGRNQYQLAPKIKKMVKVRYLNLVSDTYPLKSNNTDSFDVIFCRNVFIYFQNETVSKICKRFKSALNDDGYFFVSPTETFMVPNLFKKDRYNSAFIFRNSSIENKRYKIVDGKFKTRTTSTGKVIKPSVNYDSMLEGNIVDNIKKVNTTFKSINTTLGNVKKFKRPKVINKLPVKTKAVGKDEKKILSTAKELNSKGNFTTSVKMLEKLIKDTLSAKIKNGAYIELSRAYSSLGKMDRSIECCKQAIALDKMNPSIYFLYASLHMESGKIDESIEFFKKTLYFDSNYIVAHFMLGNLFLTFNKKTEAQRHFRNAENLLSKEQPSNIVKDSKGLTAKKMKEMIINLMK